MTEKQCRNCESLTFHTDYHDHVDCESKEMYKMYKKGEISYAASMYDGKDCPCYVKKKYKKVSEMNEKKKYLVKYTFEIEVEAVNNPDAMIVVDEMMPPDIRRIETLAKKIK